MALGALGAGGQSWEISPDLSFWEESRQEARSLLGTGAEGISGPGSGDKAAVETRSLRVGVGWGLKAKVRP